MPIAVAIGNDGQVAGHDDPSLGDEPQNAGRDGTAATDDRRRACGVQQSRAGLLGCSLIGRGQCNQFRQNIQPGRAHALLVAFEPGRSVADGSIDADIGDPAVAQLGEMGNSYGHRIGFIDLEAVRLHPRNLTNKLDGGDAIDKRQGLGLGLPGRGWRSDLRLWRTPAHEPD